MCALLRVLQPHQVLSEFCPSSILSSIQFYPVPSKFYLKVYPVLSSIPRASYTSHTANTSNTSNISNTSNTSNIQCTSNTSNASNTSNTSSTQPSRRQRMLRRELPGAAWETGSRQPGAAGRPGAESNREQPGAAGSWEQPVAASSQEQLEAQQMPDRNHISRL